MDEGICSLGWGLRKTLWQRMLGPARLESSVGGSWSDGGYRGYLVGPQERVGNRGRTEVVKECARLDDQENAADGNAMDS